MRIYVDWADWWIGLYRGPHHFYICLMPCLVLRFNRHSLGGTDEQLREITR